MALTPGTRLGIYEITATLGAGGMGEVYRATDTRLKREVAVKVLPEDLASHPERLALFQREAEVLASLNHPNIAAVYGLEAAAGSTALVMELVEGHTLDERIAQGPVPVAETLAIARQIAEALEAAHDRGIIHRDLKPANVKMRPDGVVKVLDFGLARTLEPAVTGRAGMSLAETISVPATTMQGAIQGTPAYMSPEQARGRPVDRRTDVWAFGAMLFEMLTGKQPFPGDDISQVLARVIEREPDWSLMPPGTPRRVVQAIGVCLRKNPKERVADLSAVCLAMDGAFDTPAPAIAPRKPSLRILAPVAAVALIVGAIAGALAWRASTPAPPAPAVGRFTIATPPDAEVASTYPITEVAVSPDGTRIAFGVSVAPGNPGLQIYVRGLDELQPRLLRGSEGGGTSPFFSPDGEWVGFVDVDERSLKRVSFAGGTPQTIARLDRLPLSMDWASDGTILFMLDSATGGLRRVPANGGEVEEFTTVGPGDQGHGYADVLPGGRDALISIISTSGARLGVVSLATGAVTDLQIAGSDPAYSPSGHIVYTASEGSLAAVGFDLGRLALTSRAPQTVLESVNTRPGGANFDLGASGTLVYMSGVGEVASRTLVWVDGNGREESVGVPPRPYTSPRVSPDGSRLALNIAGDIWVSELARPGTLRRVTTDPARERFPLWTPDGQRIVFESNKNSTLGIYSRAADGRGEDQPLLTNGPRAPQTDPPVGQLLSPEAWAADGRTLLFIYRSEKGDFNVGTVSTTDQQWKPLLDTGSNESNVVVAPDGRHIAYEADDSGALEVYVESFPVLGGRQVVSTGGGKNPVWSRDGRQLFYRRGVGSDGTIMVSEIQGGPGFTPSAPRELVGGAYYYTAIGSRTWDVARDGRFLMMKTVENDSATRPQIVLIQNWVEELRGLN